jgi:predicted membrane channel-forming protein YqfA (hemolysin III family)
VSAPIFALCGLLYLYFAWVARRRKAPLTAKLFLASGCLALLMALPLGGSIRNLFVFWIGA